MSSRSPQETLIPVLVGLPSVSVFLFQGFRICALSREVCDSSVLCRRRFSSFASRVAPIQALAA